MLTGRPSSDGRFHTGRVARTAPFRSIFVPALSLLLLTACQTRANGEDVLSGSTSLTQFPSAEATSAPFADAVWWAESVEPELSNLINEAVQNNFDLQAAAARVRASRAILKDTRTRRLPSLDLEGNASFNRQSVASIGIPGFEAEDQVSPSASLAASWEIDLFGRIARQIESARADAAALEASRQDLARVIAADVALAYLDLKEAQVRSKVASDNLDNQRRTLEITQTLAENGKASRLDVARAEAQVATTEARLPLLRAQGVTAKNRLTTLLGLEPGSLDSRLTNATTLPVLPAMVATGSPAAMIQRRPDVRAAEQALQAATARIGVAAADLYPTISLTGSAGASSADARDFGSSDAFTFGIGPRLSWNIFDRRAVYARIEQADATAAANLASFRQTVLIALEEVDSSLASYNEEAIRFDRLTAARNASAEARDLARARFDLGREPFLTVLDAERVLLSADDDLTASAAARLRAQIQLYRALAGGWNAGPETTSQPFLESAP